MILNDVAYGMYAAVNGSCRAEVYPARLARILGSLGNDAHELVNTVVFRGRYRHDGYAQPVGQLLDIDASVVAQKLIHHVKRKHHGLAHFYELEREIQVTFYIRRVNYIYYRIRLTVYYKISRDLLLAGIRADGVYARQIDKVVALPADHLTDLMLYRYAGEIADMLI